MHFVFLQCIFQVLLVLLFSLEELGREIHECSRPRSLDIFHKNLERIVWSSLKPDSFELDTCTVEPFPLIYQDAQSSNSHETLNLCPNLTSCIILCKSFNPSCLTHFISEMEWWKPFLSKGQGSPVVSVSISDHFENLVSLRYMRLCPGPRMRVHECPSIMCSQS